MNICFSTTSNWFLVSGVALVGIIFVWLFNLIWGLSLRLPIQKSNKRKKRADRKNKKRVLNKPGLDALVADNSNTQLKEDPNKDDSKEVSVEALRQFTYQSLVDATQDFLLDCRLSFDRLGEVFIGQMVDTKEVFAIRRLDRNLTLSLVKFMDEALILSQVNHPNLSKLIGYGVDGRDKFLVYEYVTGGSLYDRLHDNETCLDWSMRMKIALGVARALEHLQNSMVPPILHCYIEPSNIWLDVECTPKLSAFGVVRMYSYLGWRIGSYLYSMPDYSLTKTISFQADIRGFGILLLELITGRKGIFRGGGPRNEGVFLTDWVHPYLKDKENLAEIVDPKLKGKVGKEEIHEACNIAEMCLQKQPESRPLIADLVTKMNQLVT